MNSITRFTALCLGTVATACSSVSPNVDVAAASTAVVPAQSGWLAWRGPNQDGSSPETGLIDSVTLEGEGHLWSYPIAGRGTPVVANGRVFGVGYEGEGPELQELLFCLDEATGELVWEHRFPDFLSDIIYSRYAIGSPTVDPETGNVFAMTASGLLHGFTSDGEQLWEVSMMETLGRLTFPNGRTGAPLVLGDLVIVHFIFASWGPLGPARDRFFAFQKGTGEVVWSSTPGGPPKDSTFTFPVVEERDGRQVLYAGLGGGFATAVDTRTGDPLWRFPLSIGGANSSMLLHGDTLIAVHGRENLDSSTIGRMVALDLTRAPDEDGVLGADAELWRNDLVAFTSSPVLVEDRVYLTNQTGELACVDANTGSVLWHQKLGPDQLHASPVAADGKLYVPLNNGSFFILRPGEAGAEVLDQVKLEGACLGAPAISGGRIYVQTTDRLYCFGAPAPGTEPLWSARTEAVDEGEGEGAGEAVRLQLVPADGTFRAGETVEYEVRRLDGLGRVLDTVGPVDPADMAGVNFGLPRALEAGVPGVGVVKAERDGVTGTARVRTVPTLPHAQDFEGMALDQGGDEPFAFPPGHWLGARIKWKVVEREGTQVASRRLDNPLFQRTLSLVGHQGDSNYTARIDLLSDGNRRSMCSVGLVNQRYLIVLKGNHQELEVSSNMEHLKVSAPFKWKVGVWYRLATRVDLEPDGTAVVRAKAWARDEAEPADWTIEVRDPHGHRNGAFGLYAFTPQSRFTAYVDNITVTPNE